MILIIPSKQNSQFSYIRNTIFQVTKKYMEILPKNLESGIITIIVSKDLFS